MVENPMDSMEQHVRDLPRDRDIILYCSCPNEASAASAAKTLMNHGFTRVRPLHGGLDAWLEAGYTVELLEESGSPQVAATETMQM